MEACTSTQSSLWLKEAVIKLRQNHKVKFVIEVSMKAVCSDPIRYRGLTRELHCSGDGAAYADPSMLMIQG